ncbi:bifunctional (p)ppGpp synthetase II/ guanosine-3',5'-bis pyrophosphate 3'-pyrophosphohydrolase [Sorangium cellulosum]|uniref:Bifunctional (P)ppGpp synthetase II/ guanosine-3',5'-bis pyrophosphate 3'-pyrophosphohydrolase n=1 Tax=Sorangium cellulosum TaxID=56 RepID=A0A2L0EV50_SORCE|nr:bifunctional (p)ppGpp synthetase/guanosine-3',5'-bis(diphosphate) 3'-pyrophosphohydrolase [Sorangium cellulosum]AUX43188.1 bifunctional (p)ppGpp synthetase II/ guanosine-3',5'-bis pyrophosphate 3'-pyrophosphohydrolase [Sorangium cellulosum]
MLTLTELVDRVRTYQPAADVDLIARAYAYSADAHRGQTRKSGDPYFSHPASVAAIITELKLDTASVCAGLLHDVVEDTLATTTDIEDSFGEEVAFLVDGVTKLSKINFASKEDRQAENFRKMLVAMARDIRVLLVKLCDRLDNMRTLEFMKPEAQDRIARETMEIYAPLANRLGIARFKSELEDLSFRYIEPEAWADLSQKVKTTAKERDKYIHEVSKVLSAKLAEQGFAVDVTGRAKHLYSIWRKMQAQQCDFDQVYDVIAFRVLVESVADCYATLGVIHSQWTPVPGRFKDYVALPKPNMYQSLHTTVIGPGRERIEIQIRTNEMHRVAEQGIAAHWKYKEKNSGGVDPKDAARFGWLRQLMEFQKELKDPAEFLESVKVDLFQDEVYVFTPKGDVRVFPRGSTPIDFAYAIHTKVGEHCSGARVNGAIVPLRSKLRNGDVVEVMTNPSQHPSKDWLDYVSTSRARSKIRNYLRTEQREKSLKLGRELLEKEMHQRSMSLSRLTKNEAELRKVMERFGVASADELFISVGYGKVSVRAVCEFLSPTPKENEQGTPTTPPESIKEGRIESLVRKVTGRDSHGIRLNGIDDVLVRYTKCCNPLPGDEIVGFITRGRGITVHRRNCAKAFDTDPERRVEISWDARAKINRPVQIKVMTANRPGILATVGHTFHEQGINISEATCRAGDDGRAMNTFTFLCSDLAQLKSVIRRLQRIPGVMAVERT